MKEVDYTFDHCSVDCDECNTSTIVGSADYQDINAELKSEGWIVKYIDGNWYEFCSIKCMRKFLGLN